MYLISFQSTEIVVAISTLFGNTKHNPLILLDIFIAVWFLVPKIGLVQHTKIVFITFEIVTNIPCNNLIFHCINDLHILVYYKIQNWNCICLGSVHHLAICSSLWIPEVLSLFKTIFRRILWFFKICFLHICVCWLFTL